MKRIIAIKLVTFLLLGAVVTVAVAWGCAIFSPRPDDLPSRYRVAGHERWFVYHIYESLGFRAEIAHPWGKTPSPAWPGGYESLAGLYSDAGVESQDQVSTTAYRLRTGWPMKSLQAVADMRSPSVEETGAWTRLDWRRFRERSWRNAIILDSDSRNGPRRGEIIPVHPIFPGFLINILFYELVLWLLWSAPFATRRFIRRRRGRCAKCGYDLTGTEHDVCPECGQRQQIA